MIVSVFIRLLTKDNLTITAALCLMKGLLVIFVFQECNLSVVIDSQQITRLFSKVFVLFLSEGVD